MRRRGTRSSEALEKENWNEQCKAADVTAFQEKFPYLSQCARFGWLSSSGWFLWAAFFQNHLSGWEKPT